MSPELFTLILLTVWGACVGSFLNVVIYRVPAGMSVVTPPSRCPGCGTKLALHDNIPVLGWLWLRGRCRTCGMKISPQYPLIEAATAALFALVVIVYYYTGLRPTFRTAGIEHGWPVLAVHLTLVAAMVAATMIDAKLFLIPLRIPWTATVTAVVVLPLSVLAGWVPAAVLAEPTRGAAAAPGSFTFASLFPEHLIPVTSSTGLGIALGGTVGLIAAVALLRLKLLPLSFADEPELHEGTDPNDPDVFLAHPHPRREIGKELLFLMYPLVGAAAGVLAVRTVDPVVLPPLTRVVGGVLLGFLGGGALVWGTRVLGTLGFGKEAMGLGDVHLMAAIGAVLGWRDATLAFFLAPFFGLTMTVILAGAAAILQGRVRAIPYGPYLCLAALIVMLFRTPLLELIGLATGGAA